MKKLLLLTFLFPLVISAQHEFGYHATWWFHTFHPFMGYYDFVKVEHVDDTTMVGMDWLEFEVTGKRVRTIGLDPFNVEVLNPYLVFPSVYLATRNDSVFRLLSDSTEYLLYDFSGGVGDAWRFAPSDSVFDCDSIAIATVDHIGVDTIRGELIRYMDVSQPWDTVSYQFMSPSVLDSRIYYGIGNIHYVFLFEPIPNTCDGTIIEYSYSTLNCFSNDSVSVSFVDQACNILPVLSKEELNDVVFKIFPNPTQGLLNIETDEKLTRVEIYSLDGQKLIETTQSENIKLPTSSGMYVVAIYFEDGRRAVTKVVRE